MSYQQYVDIVSFLPSQKRAEKLDQKNSNVSITYCMEMIRLNHQFKSRGKGIQSIQSFLQKNESIHAYWLSQVDW